MWQLEQIEDMTGRKLSNLKRKNQHHPVPSVLADTVGYLMRIDFQTEDSHYSFIIKNIRNLLKQMDCAEEDIGQKTEDNKNGKGKKDVSIKKIKNKLKSLILELASQNYYYVPQFLHELFNRLFAGELTPAEVLLKLEWMFDKRRNYCGENKENLVDFLLSVCILEKKRIFTKAEKERIRVIRNSADDVHPVLLLKTLGLEISDIVDALSRYFFHPYWGMERFKKHFLLLMFLKPPDRLKKTNMSMYLEYYKHNGIHNVLRNMNEEEIRLLKYFLNRFSQMEWEDSKESHLDQHQ